MLALNATSGPPLRYNMNPTQPTLPLIEPPAPTAMGGCAERLSASFSANPPLCCTRSWLTLSFTPGLGPTAARLLRERFGCACAALRAPEPALRAVLPTPVAKALASPDPSLESAMAQALAWSQSPGQHLLTLADPRYPPMIAALPDPPPVLYLRGDPEALNRPAIALVGSRNATRDGLEIAQSVASAFARTGIVIASGLAAGIDSAAHRGALAAGGLTVGFIGTGADLIYPRAHQALAESVIAQGALVSELPLGSPAVAHHFPRRNRLIAAHASAVIVVQAARHSGSLITARLAADLGREVAAFPGSVHSALSRGCHQLIREGAALVEDAADIAALLESAFARQGWQPKAFPAPISRAPSADHSALSEPASQLLASLGWSPVTPDSLVQASGLPGPQAANALIELELSGLVERLIDGRFQRMRPAS